MLICRWSLIAGRLPGRTDNEIKNYWNTHLSKTLIKHGNGHDEHQNKIETKKEKTLAIVDTNNVVRTKARRCTSNVFITTTPQQQQPHFDDHNEEHMNTGVLLHGNEAANGDENTGHEIESWWDALMDFNMNDDWTWMNEASSPPIHNINVAEAEGDDDDDHHQVMIESEADETRKPDLDLDLNALAAFLDWETYA